MERPARHPKTGKHILITDKTTGKVRKLTRWEQFLQRWKSWTGDNIYLRVYFARYPHLYDKVVVHHAIEREAVTGSYRALFRHALGSGKAVREFLHGIANLRGVIRGGVMGPETWIVNHRMHLSAIRLWWDARYGRYAAMPPGSVTLQDFLEARREHDEQFGFLFAEDAWKLPLKMRLRQLGILERIAASLFRTKQEPPLTPVDWFGCRPNCPPRSTVTASPTLAQRFFQGSRSLRGAAQHGGVDFSTLELRYLADPSGDDPVAFAFSVGRARGGTTDPLQGMRYADLSSDAFFVWLALPASSFWVNLNPNEPHRIIDERFGRTDAGRILLEADLALKKTVARLTDPRRPLGRRYWSSLRGRDRCVSMRQWIVPGRADVRATDEELYIVRAPLRVKMETQYLDEIGTRAYRSCPQQSPAEELHNERVYRRLILPRVEREVNHGDRYAALRRVYHSRVAAEWVRERHGYQRTEYSDIIGSERIGRWRTSSKWKPVDTYRAYLRSYRGHEYEVTDTDTVGDTSNTSTYVFGGVDFGSVPRRNLDAATFARDHGATAKAVQRSLERLAADPTNDRLLLGGTTTDPDPSPSVHGPEGDEGATSWWVGLIGGLGVALVVLLTLARRRTR